MLPSIFGENLFDDFFTDGFMPIPVWNGRSPLYGKHAKNLMKTDVRETDTGYEVDIDLPGFKKDEISVELKDGYLTVSAAKGLDKDEKDKQGKYIRQERYAGACSRSFYVGEAVQPGEVTPSTRTASCGLTSPRRRRRPWSPPAGLPSAEQNRQSPRLRFPGAGGFLTPASPYT